MTPNEKSNLARDILRNDIFNEAVREIESFLIAEWKTSHPDAWKARERVYDRLQALMDVKAKLETYIATAALDTTAREQHGRTERYTVRND